ncbi:MAG: restriction endonuclease subunit S [Pseudomonas sp.]
MSFPAYPEYKDSEITWIGHVPTSWEVKPFKWLLSNNDGGVWGDDPTGEGDTLVLRSTDQTVDGNWRLTDPAPRKLSAKEKASALLVEGDLVVTKSSGSSLHIGKTTLVTADIAKQGCCYGNFMQRLRVNSSFTPKLTWYVMNNELARAQLDLLSNSTTGLANLNGTLIGEILLPVSTVAEQTQIARFLDHETARIDALIEEQQRLIELLKEKRQAVISHAVTKGLDPTVQMKDSGVEWLGEVPAHWNASRIKYHSTKIGDGLHATPEYDDEGDYFFINGNNLVNGGVVTTSTTRQVNHQEFIKHRVKLDASTVLISINGTIGNLALYNGEPVILGKSAAYINCSESLSRLYCLYLLSSEPIKRFFDSELTGTTIYNLSLRTIAETPTPLPPMDEQNSIVEFLNRRLDEFDGLIERAARLSQLLLERRSALISAAVTGKIDVRGWQPPTNVKLPELEREAV